MGAIIFTGNLIVKGKFSGGQLSSGVIVLKPLTLYHEKIEIVKGDSI